MPLSGTWVDADWQDRVRPTVLVARTQPDARIMFGAFFIDRFCTGIKDSNWVVNFDPDMFEHETLPRAYPSQPPASISEEMAHEMVWGAAEYAAKLGFAPHNSFQNSQRVLEPADAFPRTGTVTFGYRGRPTYVPEESDNEIAILKTLIRSVGLGNFYYIPRGEISEEIAELLEIDLESDSQESELWTPAEQWGEPESASGLWVPGEPLKPDTGPEPDEADEPSLWIPERS